MRGKGKRKQTGDKNNTRTQLLYTDLAPSRQMVEDDISLKEPLNQDQFDISHTTKKVPISIFEKKSCLKVVPKDGLGFFYVLERFCLMLPDTG